MGRLRFLAFVGLLLVLGCQRTPVPADGKSGIEGQVVVYPVTPGAVSPGDPEEAPWQDGTFTVRKGGLVITTFLPDERGRFRVPLPPGAYTVQPTDPEYGVTKIEPIELEIPRDRFIQVCWRFDTGIR